MMVNFLKEIFVRARHGLDPVSPQDRAGAPCGGLLAQAVEHAVDKVSGRLRAVPGYKRVLSEPMATSLAYIDEMVEGVPGGLICSRSSFVEDPRTNAFFVSPQHIQEVFSRSQEVRELFTTDPVAHECWALLCMRKEERRQLGMALVGDTVRKDVIQTAVNFTGHQVVSPGSSEADARYALKCCIFRELLDHIRHRITDAGAQTAGLESRLRMLQGKRADLARRPSGQGLAGGVLAEIEGLNSELNGRDLVLRTLNDQLRFMAHTLANPAEFLTVTATSLRLNRLGIKINQESDDPGYELSLSEIRVASREPRIGVLVRFPRDELLPQQDFLQKADLFLAS
jgi:hypothetical protein